MSESVAELLYQAMAEPIGLLVQTSDPERLRQRLYQARAAGGTEFSCLQFRISPFPDGNIVICKGAEPATPKAPQPLNLDDFLP